MRGAGIVAGVALRESVRRRVFVVVALLTVAFLGLYGLGVWRVSREVTEFGDFQSGVDGDVVAGATLLGLSMFATLFLGAILAVFLTLNAVRGDAERGLLQPLIVRPLGRGTFLLGRFAATAGVCVTYTVFVFLASVVITNLFIDWWPDRLFVPAFQMAVAVAVLAALALGGSVLLSSTANGIAIFMLFGAGLTAGLLGQIGEALSSETLQDVSQVTSWILPFEAHYQNALSQITADTFGFSRFAIDLGPFGGAQEFGWFLWPFTALYLGAIAFGALAAFRRRDL
ncbi:ABC transporter permease [Solirubrobacter sp. CPCC 204708]|uniref:ABC transporter permease subunit n=1 Tax=Solirubrobacter deserti TaxID=2282478 RepID=A0ABT4RGJ0_9ACTN|nr:ABC transporter permease subunit [Solirubrobacter deserti]MBE2318146.1 ABC transporter permease [Solirubrobacter deserti]MDA0137425.1 ABC transporter permease subunit [Solirubrobacter deserti]